MPVSCCSRAPLARRDSGISYPHDDSFRDGNLHTGGTPGQGVAIDEELAARFQYGLSS
jgi:hypothetical protein